MKILCNISKYDYGKKENGYSIGYQYFYDTFVNLGHQVIIFDFKQKIKKLGKEKMNEELLLKVKKEKPDIIFTMLFKEEFLEKTLLELKNNNDFKSLGWMSDDKWRFDIYGKNFIGLFDYIITTDIGSQIKYENKGQKTILSQWAIKEKDLLPPSSTYQYDVTFIGGKNSWREFVVDELKKKNINIQCFGLGWKNGKVSYEEMYRIFNQSKINLNISNSVKYNIKYILSGIIKYKKGDNLKKIFIPIADTIFGKKKKEDIKARFFEVVGAGGFLLSYNVEYIDNYFIEGEDFDIYNNIKELSIKIKKHLSDNKIRNNIANKGFNKVKKNYTYEKRCVDIINYIIK